MFSSIFNILKIKHNLFFYEDRAGLTGAIFVDEDQSFSKQYFADIFRDYLINGLSKLVIYRFGEPVDKAWNIVPPEFSDRITIDSAESIF